MPVLVTCKFDKDPIKGNWENAEAGSFLLPLLPQFRFDQPQNLMQAFHDPKDATHKIWLKLANWFWRYFCSKVWTTDDGALLGFISRNYVVWPTFLLMNVFVALKGSHFWFLFDITAAGVVPCGGRKTSPRTSTIVQFIFYFGPLRSAIIFWEIKTNWFV